MRSADLEDGGVELPLVSVVPAPGMTTAIGVCSVITGKFSSSSFERSGSIFDKFNVAC